MRRREFITLLGGTAATWPLVARAQSQERVRRIAMLIALGADNADAQAYRAAFLQALQQLGWTDGHNVQIETRWGGGSASAIRKQAADLVARFNQFERI
jgi:putative ABC transport system substrate-binding protein